MTLIIYCGHGYTNVVNDIIHHMDKAGCRGFKHGDDNTIITTVIDERQAEEVYKRLKKVFTDDVIKSWTWVN